MKKFLSLVLALIMTMSLVTISAGAAEYKDFTDKDEIQYEEAVAVLNKLGIITGYDEGDFRPEGQLTRGAAAKIIVSLLIGPEAAGNVSPTSAPYKDVPLDHTFAGVIAYCKTAGIISGYSDGSFQPGGTLTGYAFSKMLLGALGYKGETEGFTGPGWNMNVSRLGNEARLFDHLSFQGNEPVNREQAAQLALNTLKATMVEYTGGGSVVAGTAQVNFAQNRIYKTSNQEFAKHINNKKAGNQTTAADALYTVEFGEEHFVDLRMDNDRDTPDAFGRVSNKWSYKKVTIGTYPVEPDASFDHQISHLEDSVAAKKRATGLGDYKVTSGTKLWLNGVEHIGILSGVEDIADYTDNGTLVEVYVSDTIADLITDVVVIRTQLMEIKRIGSSYVSLQMYDNKKSDNTKTTTQTTPVQGFNQFALNETVENVQEEDNAYTLLSSLKTGDIVAVVPVAVEHSSSKFEVSSAYVPETVSGSLSHVNNYGAVNSTSKAIAVTVGGTKYNIANWSKDLVDIDDDDIKVTRKDVTLYLDKNGNAMLAKDVGSTEDWMIVGNFRQNIEDGQMVWIVNGWDIKGTELSLDLGPRSDKPNYQPGDLVHYTSKTGSNKRDWSLNTDGVYSVFAGEDSATHKEYEIKSSNSKIQMVGYDKTDDNREYVANDVKFIYVHFDADNPKEVESIEVKSGVQNVKNKELLTTANTTISANDSADSYGYNRAEAAVKIDNKDSSKNAVKAVVIKSESNEAIATNMLYIRDYNGSAGYDDNGKMIYGYTVSMNGSDGILDEEMEIYSDKKLDKGDFASYTAKEGASNLTPFYELRRYNNLIKRTTSTFRTTVTEILNNNKNIVTLSGFDPMQEDERKDLEEGWQPDIFKPIGDTLGVGDVAGKVSLRKASWVDLTGHDIASTDQLSDYVGNGRTVDVALIVNDNSSNDNFRMVSMIVILHAIGDEDKATNPDVTITPSVTSVDEGGSVVLTANVNNINNLKGNLTYTWEKDGVKIDGATSSSYTVDNAANAKYKVTVTHHDKNFAVDGNGTAEYDLKVNRSTVVNVGLTITADVKVTYNKTGELFGKGSEGVILNDVRRGSLVVLTIAGTEGSAIDFGTLEAKWNGTAVAISADGKVEFAANENGTITIAPKA